MIVALVLVPSYVGVVGFVGRSAGLFLGDPVKERSSSLRSSGRPCWGGIARLGDAGMSAAGARDPRSGASCGGEATALMSVSLHLGCA